MRTYGDSNMMKKLFIFLTAAILGFGLFSCDNLLVKEEDQSWGGGKSDNPLMPPVIPESDRVAAASNIKAQILQDSEPSETVMNQTKRWWKLTEPVRIETKTDYKGGEVTLKDDQIVLTSYSLYPITGIEVFDGAGADAKYLFTIGDISALARNVYTIPEGKTSTTGKYVVKSKDAHFLKIAGGKLPLTLKFHKLNDLWGNLNPIEAREYIAFWTNVGFTFSSDEFDILLRNYVQLTGGKFKDDHNSAYVTEHDLANEPKVVEEIKSRIFKEKTLNVGLIGSDTENDGDTKGGQATASALGVTTVNFAKLYFIGIGVGVHEFGHTIDYDHKSSFSSDLQNYAGGLSACFIRLGKAPYSNKDLIGYCKEQNQSKRKIQSPNQAMLSAKYNDAEVERNYTHFYQKYVGRIDNVWIGYKFEPGRNPAEGGSAIITTEEQTRESTQFVNAFEKAVYKNQNLYPDLHKALKPYFDTAKAAGIDLTK